MHGARPLFLAGRVSLDTGYASVGSKPYALLAAAAEPVLGWRVSSRAALELRAGCGFIVARYRLGRRVYPIATNSGRKVALLTTARVGVRF